MRWISAALAAGLLLALAAPAADEPRISIYSPVANYSLPLAERGGHEYVGLLEILEPLGQVAARADGHRWKLRFNNNEAEFKAGNSQVRIRGHNFDLTRNFLLESGRGLVPVAALTTLLPRFLGFPVVFHVTARRLFINQPGTTYAAELNKAASQLVIRFSAPVNPAIATEPGKLRMLFVRDPLVPSGPENTNFDNKAIAAATVKEGNGALEIAIAGSVPLLASFSDGNRTITIAPAPGGSPAVPAVATQTAPGPGAAPSPSAAPPPVQPSIAPLPPVAARRVFAVLDASHGGEDKGATFSDRMVEKDVTLAFARKIREELQNRGIPALVLRDSDATMTLDQRASLANGTRSTVYIAVHASTDGLGVRVCTALVPAAGPNSGPFLSWNSAQTQFLPAARSAADSLAAELRKKIPARVVAAPLRPLNHITMPALAVEIASQTGDASELLSLQYQQLVAAAVADGVVAARSQLEAAH